jgi:hypothetical protein
MAYLKFNIEDELVKAARGQKTKADPLTLLSIILSPGAFARLLKQKG